MRVIVDGKRRNFRSVWMYDDTVFLINQRLLPHKFEIYKSESYRTTADAIKNMVVRGAPAIGATAAFGIAQAILEFDSEFDRFQNYMKTVTNIFYTTRPTAYDLFHAINFILKRIENVKDMKNVKDIAIKESQRYADESVERCKSIGKIGEKLIKDGMNVLTHCNAGALGCVDYGTALSPIRFAHYNNKRIHVFIDETRPRMQGSRLTAWELLQEGIEHSIISDNASGYFMQRGDIDLVIVGADRIALNGDVANKIGTYEKAVVANENGIPFYVAAPKSTIDFNCISGKDIEIEERNPSEVLSMWGLNEKSESMCIIRVSPKKSKARNPAFDITPARYITGIITEDGIYKPDEIALLNNL